MSARRLLALEATMDDRLLRDVGDPNDTEELDALMVTALMVLLFIVLIVMLYLAQYLATKWWYVVTLRLYRGNLDFVAGLKYVPIACSLSSAPTDPKSNVPFPDQTR